MGGREREREREREGEREREVEREREGGREITTRCISLCVLLGRSFAPMQLQMCTL